MARTRPLLSSPLARYMRPTRHPPRLSFGAALPPDLAHRVRRLARGIWRWLPSGRNFPAWVRAARWPDSRRPEPTPAIMLAVRIPRPRCRTVIVPNEINGAPLAVRVFVWPAPYDCVEAQDDGRPLTRWEREEAEDLVRREIARREP